VIETLTTSHRAAADYELLEITVPDLLRRSAVRYPNKDALVIGDENPAARARWTYAELLEAVEDCAGALRAQFRPGERIAIWAPNVPQWVVLQLALAEAGLVMVTMNPAFTSEEARYVLAKSEAAGAFVVPMYGRVSPLEVARGLYNELPSLRTVVSFAEWDEFLAKSDRREHLVPVLPDDIAQIQYTSGTTGFPRGAMLRHRGVANNAILMAERVGVTEASIFVRPSLLYHVGGSVASVLMAISAAATLIPMTKWSPRLAAELIQDEAATLTGGVPTMMQALLDYARENDLAISSLTTVILGAAPIPADLVRELRTTLSINTVTMYGQTESGPTVTMTHLDDLPEDTAETAGDPLPGTETRIVAENQSVPAPLGAVGELQVRSPMTMAGYLDDPDETGRTIDADGWLHTGDLCTMNERGYVRVVGRMSDMIIRGGANVYPREIEEALLAHGDVAEIAVLGLPHARLGEEVVAFVRTIDGAPPDVGELARYAAERLARYKVPTRWLLVESFPLTSTGKIQKGVLKERASICPVLLGADAPMTTNANA
jgi:fatty-acyl-CoA synthase